jgi:hypothetical protein
MHIIIATTWRHRRFWYVSTLLAGLVVLSACAIKPQPSFRFPVDETGQGQKMLSAVQICRRAFEEKAPVSQVFVAIPTDHILCYYGQIDKEGWNIISTYYDNREIHAVKVMVIRSSGGNAEYGRAMGRMVFRGKRDVIVDRVCLSSCANYIFTAGNRKYLSQERSEKGIRRGFVGFHGGVVTQEIIDEAESEKKKRALKVDRERSQEFFKEIGVNWLVMSQYPSRVADLAQRGGIVWTYTAEEFAKFGVRDIYELPVIENVE